MNPFPSPFAGRRNADQTTSNTSTLHLFERWTDSSGIQALRMGIEAKDLVISGLGQSDSVNGSYLLTDHAKVRVRVLDQASGLVTRTVMDGGVLASGTHTLAWDGKNDVGGPAARCRTYSVEIRAIGLYADAETSNVSANFYFKPQRQRTATINSNVPGTRLTFDGRDSTLVGNTYAVACSLCTAHTVEVPPVQVLSGTRYCFQSWTGGGNRLNTVVVQADTTIQLTLTVGTRPYTFAAGVTLPIELFDSKRSGIPMSTTWISTGTESSTLPTSISRRLIRITSVMSRVRSKRGLS